MHFDKYHALGNDYLIFDPRKQPQVREQVLEAAMIRRICHRHFGLGSDGILYGPVAMGEQPYGLRIFNPDGSEAEKSGNGLRIFARYLYDHGDIGKQKFIVVTLGGEVQCQILDKDKSIMVAMGQVSFNSKDIPVTGPEREVLQEVIEIRGVPYSYCAATIGNPHCVLPLNQISKALACELGPQLEQHPNFPNRTNVQLLRVLDRQTIALEIWERGAGYTLASGSSSSAAAAVARRLGLCDEQITVQMPGGQIDIAVAADYTITMTGPVTRVGQMSLG